MTLLKKILTFLRTSKTPELSRASDGSRKTFIANYNDRGKFKFEEDGFVFNSESGQKKVKWGEIEQLIAYKQDLLTFDEICIDIVYDNQSLTISEGTHGWSQFVEKTKLIFPSIPNNWEAEIMFPAFKTNLTVIYERPD